MTASAVNGFVVDPITNGDRAVRDVRRFQLLGQRVGGREGSGHSQQREDEGVNTHPVCTPVRFTEGELTADDPERPSFRGLFSQVSSSP